jgi:hypothetical protein
MSAARPPEGARPLRLRRGEAQAAQRTSLGEVTQCAARPPEGARPLRLRRGEEQPAQRAMLGEVSR